MHFLPLTTIHSYQSGMGIGWLKKLKIRPGSRGRLGPGGVQGQRPAGGPRGAKPPGRKRLFTNLRWKEGLSWHLNLSFLFNSLGCNMLVNAHKPFSISVGARAGSIVFIGANLYLCMKCHTAIHWCQTYYSSCFCIRYWNKLDSFFCQCMNWNCILSACTTYSPSVTPVFI